MTLSVIVSFIAIAIINDFAVPSKLLDFFLLGEIQLRGSEKLRESCLDSFHGAWGWGLQDL